MNEYSLAKVQFYNYHTEYRSGASRIFSRNTITSVTFCGHPYDNNR